MRDETLLTASVATDPGAFFQRILSRYDSLLLLACPPSRQMLQFVIHIPQGMSVLFIVAVRFSIIPKLISSIPKNYNAFTAHLLIGNENYLAPRRHLLGLK